jgi:ATP-dependent helicase/nuclease subunit B
LIEGFPDQRDPFSLSKATIYVPTRRAARALNDALVKASPGGGLILPRIAPLGAFEPNEETQLFAEPAQTFDAPPAISDLARRMVLARLIAAWSLALKGAIRSVKRSGQRVFDLTEAPLVVASAAQAFSLAGDLAGLIDEMTIEAVPWERLETLTPSDFDDYWRITLDFLKIAATQWPAFLAERGLIDEATRGALLVEREIARLETGQAAGPIIVAGSTGARRATASLIAAVAKSAQGAVVLPDLDLALDDAAWRMIREEALATHPQAGLSRLMETMGATRADVRPLGDVAPSLAARSAFLSEALRPAGSTDLWRRREGALAEDRIAAALDGVSLIEAADEAEEALALAIALRGALEEEGTVAALVSPDLGLTRRVKAELQRWRVAVDDTAGDKLDETPEGVFARLALTFAGTRAPLDLVALLAHPVARLSRAPAEIAAARRALELGVLRGMPLGFALDDGRRLVEAARAAADQREDEARRRLGDADWRAAEALLTDVLLAIAPLDDTPGPTPVAALIDAHRGALERLCRTEAGENALIDSDAGEALFALMAEWRQAAPEDFAINAGEYRALFEAILAVTPAPDAPTRQGRVQILGLLEARLLAFDLTVVAGLDESVWPPVAETDAFLNRPMRAALGLSPPERRIGQTAHDFVAALGAPRVILSRAKKRGGAPTVPSRFLQRIAAAAGPTAFSAAQARGETSLALARLIDRPPSITRVKRPAPKPPLSLRPTSLSVTRIETLRRDPYAIFAERILRLKPLDPIGESATAREIGVEWHAVLSEFDARFGAGLLPPEAPAALFALARERFAPLLSAQEFDLLVCPRIAQGLEYFLAYDREARADLAEILTEEKGALVIGLGDGSSFRLTAVADRIEIRKNGDVFLVDYKTGGVPGLSEVRSGFAPQLTLEAAMVARGAFANAPPRMPSGALYLKLGGARGGDKRFLTFDKEAFGDVVEEHYDALLALLRQFAQEDTPYLSRPFPKFVGAFGVYDHLARVKEWSASGGLADEAGDET